MSLVQRVVVNFIAFIALSMLLPSLFYVSSFTIAIVASLVLTGLNLFIRPILMLLSLPITLITFGLFSFIINAAMLQMTSVVVGNAHFAFSSFGASILIAIIMSFINSIVAKNFVRRY